MPVNSDAMAFTKANVDGSPDKPGVYVLLKNGKVTYYGMSTTSIRKRLQSHLAGNEGKCTQSATKYRREVTTALQAPIREAALLADYKKANGGYPNCNEKGA